MTVCIWITEALIESRKRPMRS